MPSRPSGPNWHPVSSSAQPTRPEPWDSERACVSLAPRAYRTVRRRTPTACFLHEKQAVFCPQPMYLKTRLLDNFYFRIKYLTVDRAVDKMYNIDPQPEPNQILICQHPCPAVAKKTLVEPRDPVPSYPAVPDRLTLPEARSPSRPKAGFSPENSSRADDLWQYPSAQRGTRSEECHCSTRTFPEDRLRMSDMRNSENNHHWACPLFIVEPTAADAQFCSPSHQSSIELFVFSNQQVIGYV